MIVGASRAVCAAKQTPAGNGNWNEDLKINLQNLQRVNTQTHGTRSLASSLFFLAKELERTRSLSRLGTVAPDQQMSSREQHGRLGMSAWASRYVLLWEWGESATKFTMNVSNKTSCFRSKIPTTESSFRQSRPDRSSSFQKSSLDE